MDIPQSDPATSELEESAEQSGDDAAPSPTRDDRVTSPQEALEKIRLGEKIEGVKIVGLVLKGEFDKPIRFQNVTLVNPEIRKATFAEDVSFEHCTLDRLRVSRDATFAKGLSFKASTLIRPELRRLHVHGTLRCDNARFRGKAMMDACKFSGKVRFWEAQFAGWVDFRACEFFDEADFRSLHAEQGLVLTSCQFRGDVLFRGATIEKKWQGDKSRFDALLDFSKAKLHDVVYLEAIEQGERQSFGFLNALAERVLVRPDQLEGRIASEQGGDFAQAMQEYGLLKRIFEGLHRYESEDWAFYRFKVCQRRGKPRSWSRPWTKLAELCDWLFLDLGCGYGANPVRAVRAAMLIILAFGAVYAWGIGSVQIESPPFDGPKESLINRAMIGALMSVSAFTSGFGDIRGAAHGWMNVPLIAESLLGTLLWGLFIVAFSRKVIR